MQADLEWVRDQLFGRFMTMAAVVFSEDPLQKAVDLICFFVQDASAGTGGAGVTLVEEGGAFTASHSDDVTKQADAMQYALGQGPCLSAWQRRSIIRIDSMPEERRWPLWCSAGAAMGIMSSLSVPLRVAGTEVGAMKAYSPLRSNYDERDEEIMRMLAERSSIVITSVWESSGADQLSERLADAMETRRVIGIAEGILIAREGLDEEGAFRMLREAALRNGIKLGDAARELVTGATRPGGRPVLGDSPDSRSATPRRTAQGAPRMERRLGARGSERTYSSLQWGAERLGGSA